MASIVFENFSGGLDLRRSQSMSAVNVLFKCNNAYVTTGRAVRKRPCATRFAVLGPGTVGLEAGQGKLNTFSGVAVTHTNPLLANHVILHPVSGASPSIIHYSTVFNTQLYVVAGYPDGTSRHFYNDVAVADTSCPHTRVVEKIGQKIYAASAGPGGAGTHPPGSNVDYCKTSDPTNWSAPNDAGFLPSGIEAVGSDTVTALGNFRGDLSVFFSDSSQLWGVDPDPAQTALIQNNANVGTIHAHSPRDFANDLTFLAKMGFRSMSLATITLSLTENDIGSPIDKLRPDIGDNDNLRSLFYPTLGQLWEIDGATAYVLSYSKSNKVTAWSLYTYPFTIDAACVLNNELYARSGDIVYRMDATAYADDGVVPLCEVDMFYQDNKRPGILKQFWGYDAVVEGTPQVAFGFDPRKPALQTDWVDVTGDTRPDALAPMELACTSLAPRFRHQRNEAFQLDMFQPYYEELGAV